MHMKSSQTGMSSVSRRVFLGGVASAGALVGTGLLPNPPVHAGAENGCKGRPNPIPGGGAPFRPFGIFVHHNGLNPAVPLASIKDPSQITDFDGFVGLTHIRGAGVGTMGTGESVNLAYQADMGFSQGKFIATDGRRHQGTFAFV